MKNSLTSPFLRTQRWWLAFILSLVNSLGLGEETPTSAVLAPDHGGVRLELVSEVETVQPGVPFRVGLRIEHRKGWHTYWKSPGIVGVPTSIDWELPEGFHVGPMQWPTPELVEMLIIRAHGYQRDVLLTMEVVPPATWDGMDQGLDLKGAVSWMSCATTCHPGWGEVSLSLPVREEGPSWSRWRDDFDRVEAEAPPKLKDWEVSVTREEQEIVLRLDPLVEAQPGSGDVRFFAEDQQVHSDEDQELTWLPNGGLELRLQPSPFPAENPKFLRGLISREDGWTVPTHLGPDVRVSFVEIEASWPRPK